MPLYKVTMATGTDPCAGTIDRISIALVGAQRESAKHFLSCVLIPGTCIDRCAYCIRDLRIVLGHCKEKTNPYSGKQVTDFELCIEEDLGELLLIRLYKERNLIVCEDAWYCQYINVTCPNGRFYEFPFYQWVYGLEAVEVPEGKGIILSRNPHSIIMKQRQTELEKKRETHKWKSFVEGIPRCIDVERVEDLPYNDQFSCLKKTSFTYRAISTGLESKLKELLSCTDSWTSLEDIKIIFGFRTTEIAEKVSMIWKEDDFFGYQFLNGVNPMLIRKCSRIPANFPVNDNMVAPSLGTSTCLQKEFQSGNIFLADYKMIQGIPPNKSINQKPQYLASPMCLLWKNLQDELVPIAIQLGQTSREQTPIFLPSDCEWDWTLAKIWVRNSDFIVHQITYHLLRTHLLAEVFNIATTRQLPMGHPVYKLIVPHLRFTLEINTIGRNEFFGPGGIFEQILGSGNEGAILMLKKGTEEMTYSSLCLPDDIKSRGMESIPNYLYREDGMKIWAAIESFVSSMVHYYYCCDEMVRTDPELQAWVLEIFREGFLESTSSGIPSSLETTSSLITFLTMVIFTCSAQHSAVNGGQFDFYSWMPNGPSSMRSPPPTAKGVNTLQSILDALPEVNTTTTTMSTMWLLSNEPRDRVKLVDYPDMRFTEETPQKCIKEFQIKLQDISRAIRDRNEGMSLPYAYLDPRVIEKSISI